MKKIKNIYNKRLSFILGNEGSFSIDTQEEKTVPDDLAERLLTSNWIIEPKEEKVQEEIQEPLEDIEQEEPEEIQVEEEQWIDEEVKPSKKRKKIKKVEE